MKARPGRAGRAGRPDRPDRSGRPDRPSGSVFAVFTPRRRRATALVLLGFLAGLVTGLVVLSARLDRLALERDQLRVETADLEVRVERLQERLDKLLTAGAGPVIGKVDLEIDGLDDMARLEVRSRAAGLVEGLVGKNVSEVDPALAYHLLNDRAVTFEGRVVRLEVRAVVLGPETVFWLEISLLPQGGGAGDP